MDLDIRPAALLAGDLVPELRHAEVSVITHSKGVNSTPAVANTVLSGGTKTATRQRGITIGNRHKQSGWIASTY